MLARSVNLGQENALKLLNFLASWQHCYAYSAMVEFDPFGLEIETSPENF